MASKDRIKLFFGAGLALAVGAVFADTTQVVSTTPVVRQTFEDGASEDDVVGTWSGDGAVKDESIESTSIGNNVARPITGESDKVFAIAGEVTCTSTTASGNYVVSDFLVNITEGIDSDEGLKTPEGDVQIAVAAGPATNDAIPLCVYSKNKSGDLVWTPSSIAIDKTKWHRLTLVFDYENKTCQVNWDGVPVATSAGYLESNPKSTKNTDGGTPIAGSWYNLATGNKKTSIATLKFVGAASIDDVLVTQGEKTDVKYGDSAVATVNLDGTDVSIPVKDLSEWGVGGANITTAKIDNSGLTVAEKLAAGLEPDDGKKFEFTEMALGSGNTATIKFRGSTAVNHGVLPSYTVKVNGTAVTDGDGNPVTVTDDPKGEKGIVAASIPLKDDVPVNKITIEATATAPAKN